MAVFRVERTRDYTVMCNHHLKDSNLSLKAKGLLSMMLSLPDEWNYTTRGLATICKEGVDAIGKTLKELELAGYIIRRQLRGKDGRISDTEYTIFEKPRKPSPPDTTLPDTENPYLDRKVVAALAGSISFGGGDSIFKVHRETVPSIGSQRERHFIDPLTNQLGKIFRFVRRNFENFL